MRTQLQNEGGKLKYSSMWWADIFLTVLNTNPFFNSGFSVHTFYKSEESDTVPSAKREFWNFDFFPSMNGVLDKQNY